MQLIPAGICWQSPHKHSLTAVPGTSLLHATIRILNALCKLSRLSLVASLCLTCLNCCSLLLCRILPSRSSSQVSLLTTNQR